MWFLLVAIVICSQPNPATILQDKIIARTSPKVQRQEPPPKAEGIQSTRKEAKPLFDKERSSIMTHTESSAQKDTLKKMDGQFSKTINFNIMPNDKRLQEEAPRRADHFSS